MDALIYFQKLFVVCGALDLGLGCYIMMSEGSGFNNPYLTYSPFRPIFTMCVPALWWYVLSLQKRQLQSALAADSDKSI